ncbi:uncharacterized protein UPF0158 [Algoriphagus antarcticus]|uniref:Uncharacterized protein UPF0158 n=2 Tax=Algoriphagus antarcticus TaxID=238540 RepID=A0A3E0DS10_9BACT|nr:uncharacterized protein UPF0158 [Algoriphagus antarcticus]
MDSGESFQLMEDFTNSLTDTHFKDKLLHQLSNRKPFQNFMHTVDESEYRQDWFDLVNVLTTHDHTLKWINNK